MKRLLLFTLTLAMLTVANVQQVRAYSTDDLTTAGWTQVTDLGSLTVSDYYFVLVDAGTSNYSVANPLPGTNEKPAYQVLIDPLADKSQLWKLSYDSANARYSIQSAVDDWYFQGGTGANQGWTDLMSNALNDNCYFTFANSDGKFSITSTISTGTFVGPWNDNGAVNLAGNRNWNNTVDGHYESLACNKSAERAPGYYIYSISRSTYDAAYTAASAALTANGWTLVNTAEGLGLDGYYYAFVDCSEDGYESNLVMAGSTNSRPNYQVFDANATIQHWNLIAKGEGFQMQNRNTNTYAVCNDGASWNTGFTNDAANQYTEFRFTLADGKWTICNVCATDNFLGRWENSPLRPVIGESIAANKAAAAGKRLFLIYSIPTIAGVAQALPEGGAMAADQWYYFDTADANYVLTATTLGDITYTQDGTQILASATSEQFASDISHLAAGRCYIKSASAQTFTYSLSAIADKPEGKMNATVQSELDAAYAAFLADPSEANAATANEKIAAANASIAEYAKIKARLDVLTTENQLGGISVATAQTLTYYANYTNGTYTSLNEVEAAYRQSITDYWTANTPAAEADLTAFVVNNSFETGVNNLVGWTTPQAGNDCNIHTIGAEGSTYYTSPAHGNSIFNNWANSITTLSLEQTITGVPNGTYELSYIVAGYADGSPITTTFNTNSDVYECTTEPAVGVRRTLQTIVTDGTIRIRVENTGKGSTFFKADDFHLIYKSAEFTVAPTLATGQMNAGAKAEMQTALATWEADRSVENFNALLATIDAANQSVELYKQIKARLDLLTSESQRGSLSEETVKGLEFYAKYSNGTVNEVADATTGTYTSVDEILPLYQANIAAYYAANTPAANDDLTAFVVNQGFEFGNFTNWVKSAENSGGDTRMDGNGKGQANPEGNYVGNIWTNNFEEVYLYQDITNLPNGTYEVSAMIDTFVGHNVNFSANSSTTTTDDAAEEIFYQQTVQGVVSNGTLTIRIQSPKEDGTAYFRIDNVRLKYLSADATIQPAIVDAPMNADIATAQQTALDTWTASKTVENYNALLAAIEAAQASADKYVTINTIIPKLEAQKGSVDVAGLTTKYNAGEYVEVDDVFTAYHDIVKTALASPADDTDMTPFIINPSFEFGDMTKWSYNNIGDTGVKDAANDTYKMTNSDGNYVFNTWDGGGSFLWLVQTLTDLPQGTYELTATWASYNDTQIEFTAENVQPDGTIDEEKMSFKPLDDSGLYGPETGLVKTLRFFVSDGTLKIGGHANGFFKADNFQLKYVSSSIDVVDTTQPMNRYERENYQKALTDYNADPSSDNLRELMKQTLIAENSIEAYQAAQATLERVKSMMSKTNVYTFDAYFTIDDMYRKYGNDPANGVQGLVYHETLEDDVAFDLERMFFGAGHYRNYVQPFGDNPDLTWMGDIPAVPFIASAWDCEYDGYAYRYKDELTKEDGTHFTEGSDYYANTWSTEGIDDGTNMLNPYLEYWRYGDDLLAPRTMTATVDGTPGKEYSVKMFVRVRTNQPYYDEANDPNHENPITEAMPKGMSIQIGDGTPVVPNWQFIDNRDSYYKLNNENQLWVCNLWDYTEEDLPKGYVDADGKLHIKFIIGDDSNVTWLSMKDVYVNYNGEDLSGMLAQLQNEVDYANTNFYTKLGFDTGEYAPYTNVEELIALRRAQQVRDASENYFLLKAAYDQLYAYNHGGENGEGTWTQNEREMNGFYWSNDYTADDVQHVEWYEYEDDCITPSGWELIGREDGFSTGIKKLGVNTDDEGMKAINGETGLLTKYETDYGQQTGYTLPLKAGVKYIMTFKYAYMGEGECTETTRVNLTVPTANADDTANSGLEVTSFKPEGQGTTDLSKWYMYRATFTPNFTGDYLITFDKDNAHDPEPIMLGELTLVRYKEASEMTESELHVDGTNQAGYSYTPTLIGSDFKLTRSWNPGAYNTLVLPFTLNGNELKTALGENFDGKVYFYKGAKNTGGEYYQLQFEARENGGIFANVPVMIWCDATNPINSLTGYTFPKTVTQYVDNDTNDDNHPTIFDPEGYDFVGTYETIKIPAGASYIHSDNTFHKSTGRANLAATRAYFIPLDMKGNLNAGAKLMGFSIDEVPTGIVAIEEDGEMHVTSGNIYTVDGRLVRANATTLEGLPSGTYVVDGKKYFVK